LTRPRAPRLRGVVLWFLLLFAVFGLVTPWVGATVVRRSRRKWREYDRSIGDADDGD
jgi:hypothetical protein